MTSTTVSWSAAAAAAADDDDVDDAGGADGRAVAAAAGVGARARARVGVAMEKGAIGGGGRCAAEAVPNAVGLAAVGDGDAAAADGNCAGPVAGVAAGTWVAAVVGAADAGMAARRLR